MGWGRGGDSPALCWGGTNSVKALPWREPRGRVAPPSAPLPPVPQFPHAQSRGWGGMPRSLRLSRFSHPEGKIQVRVSGDEAVSESGAAFWGWK